MYRLLKKPSPIVCYENKSITYVNLHSHTFFSHDDDISYFTLFLHDDNFGNAIRPADC